MGPFEWVVLDVVIDDDDDDDDDVDVDDVVAYMHIFKCVSSFFMLHGLRPFLGVVISATSTRFFLCTTRSCG